MKELIGTGVALVTPFKNDLSVDYDALKNIVNFNIENGTNYLVIMGTTGESVTINKTEKKEIIKVISDANKGRLPLVLGIGGNNTAEVIDEIKNTDLSNISALLSVSPYYSKPTQEGIYQHFKAIAEAVDLPVVLYNVPGRTVADMAHDTVMRLAQVPGIVGIKEATGDIARALHLIKDAPKDFAIYSGDDPTAVALILLGGHGNISVTANVAPKAMSEICAAALAGDAKTAAAKQLALMPLHKALFIEANPIPVKWAAARMGLCQPGLRLPLTPLSDSCHATVEAAMKTCGLI